MFTCCLPRSGGCRRKKVRPENAVSTRCPFRAPHRLWPFGRKEHKTMDEIGRRLADSRDISGTWGVTPQGSPGADVPRPKELEPAPTPSAALQGGVVPAETSAGDQEPAVELAVDPAPAHGEPDADQEGPAGEPVPGEPAPVPATVPTRASAPVPAPNCGPAPSPDPAPALDPDPSLPLPVPLSLPLTQIVPWFLPGENVRKRRSPGGKGDGTPVWEDSAQHPSQPAGAPITYCGQLNPSLLKGRPVSIIPYLQQNP
uniref:Skin secretory protein xP2-like n=1 Tax=Callorhinus ursinus TaxID=34884 RepID=A0A3Q7N731_CALUR|nr:skin secretory protein xP2-like [Callorhinus ursinus]